MSVGILLYTRRGVTGGIKSFMGMHLYIRKVSVVRAVGVTSEFVGIFLYTRGGWVLFVQ